MKLSGRTVQLLKNFSSINKSIVIRRGNILSTISQNKEILARATIPETFERSFGIYELPRLLGILTLFDEPDIQFETNHLKVVEGKQSISYYYTDEQMIVAPPDKDISLSEPTISFNLDQNIYAALMKALNVMQLPSIGVVGNKNKIMLTAMDAETKSTNDSYQVEVGETEHEFKMVFKGEHFKMLQDNYNVTISANGISKFVGTDVQYWIALQKKTSTFVK